MKFLILSQGRLATVSNRDFKKASAHKWTACFIGRRIYAVRKIRKPCGQTTSQYLHRFLRPGVAQVDHRDGDGLNNQRRNLRAATSRQNLRAFRRKAAGMSSRFRGVSWESRRERWRAEIKTVEKHLHLGYFKTEKEAAQTYNRAAKRYFGQFASLNQI